jgi:hypothetical protein
MGRSTYWKLMQLLLMFTVLALGIDTAQAGPGGGTYYANSPSGGTSGAALHKFVDSLPGLGSANANNLGQYIPIAGKLPDPTGKGDDYYEIGLVQYGEKMHTDLPKKTTLRGYKDLNPAFANISAHYLGPLIIAKSYDPTKPKGVNGNGQPTRIKFRNLLPTGRCGQPVFADRPLPDGRRQRPQG